MAQDNLSAFGNHPDIERGKMILTELFKASINGTSLDEALEIAWED